MQFFHTALSVKNLAESQKFFEDVFELTFKVRGERPAQQMKFVMLEDKNGVVVELFEHAKAKPLQEDLMEFQNIGLKHIAFIVEDMEAVIKKAQKYGATVAWTPQKGVTVKKLAFIKEPNGIAIELIER